MLDELIEHDEDVLKTIALDAADSIGLKVSKAGGLTVSVQDTVGSAIAFAGIVHLGQTIPSHLLKCILDVRDMVTVETADFEASIVDGGVKAPDLPGLGLKVKPEILGKPLANWTA